MYLHILYLEEVRGKASEMQFQYMFNMPLTCLKVLFTYSIIGRYMYVKRQYVANKVDCIKMKQDKMAQTKNTGWK